MSKKKQITSNVFGTNTGHGHVWKRPDKMIAHCGGPVVCDECKADLAMAGRTQLDFLPTLKLAELEKAAIKQALAAVDSNRTHAAKLLGISLRTLQRKMKQLGLP